MVFPLPKTLVKALAKHLHKNLTKNLDKNPGHYSVKKFSAPTVP